MREPSELSNSASLEDIFGKCFVDIFLNEKLVFLSNLRSKFYRFYVIIFQSPTRTIFHFSVNGSADVGVRNRCPMCPASFTDVHLLRDHLAGDHFGYTPYRCPQCSFARFSTEFAVVAHNRLAHGGKPFMVGAKKSFFPDLCTFFFPAAKVHHREHAAYGAAHRAAAETTFPVMQRQFLLSLCVLFG
jgi:hypothetical protein